MSCLSCQLGEHDPQLSCELLDIWDAIPEGDQQPQV